MLAQSKYIKSMLYLGNIMDDDVVTRRSCLTLQHFDYNLERMLGERRELLNTTLEAIMNLSIKVQVDYRLTDIYRVFEDNRSCRFTVLFNGEFDYRDELVGYDNALVVTGYLLQIDECYKRTIGVDEAHDRALLNMKVVMTEMQYVGSGSSIEIKF